MKEMMMMMMITMITITTMITDLTRWSDVIRSRIPRSILEMLHPWMRVYSLEPYKCESVPEKGKNTADGRLEYQEIYISV